MADAALPGFKRPEATKGDKDVKPKKSIAAHSRTFYRPEAAKGEAGKKERRRLTEKAKRAATNKRKKEEEKKKRSLQPTQSPSPAKKQRAEQAAIQPTTPSAPMMIPQQVETPHHLRTVYPSSLHRLPTVHETPRQRKLASARRRQRTAEKRLSLRENRLNVAKSGVDMIVKSQRESENLSGCLQKNQQLIEKSQQQLTTSQQQITANQQQFDAIVRQKEADRCDLNAAIATFQEESLQLEDDLDEKDEIDDEVEQLEAEIEED
ncbi:MAG: hypothetical protein SGILL_005221, partial [Bacillariaceae sp.]